MGVAARSLQNACSCRALLGMAGSVGGRSYLTHRKGSGPQLSPDRQALRVDLEQVIAATRVIAGTAPTQPGVWQRRYLVHFAGHLRAQGGDDYVVMLNEGGYPTAAFLLRRRAAAASDKVDEYVGDKMQGSPVADGSIQQRQRTIFRVAKSIIQVQWEFLGAAWRGCIRWCCGTWPRISACESTISRVTTNKYVHTPKAFELKYFFNSGLSTSGGGDDVSSESVKSRIKEIIDREDPKKPLSDQRIAEILSGETVNIARRTVTKYREMMRIGSSSERRRHF